MVRVIEYVREKVIVHVSSQLLRYRMRSLCIIYARFIRCGLHVFRQKCDSLFTYEWKVLDNGILSHVNATKFVC